ncbi:MAG: type II toxin-antitoxin system HicA family toxin [Oxalobacter formigenes]|nr:type II toxin-antitoxin system HicA family toxin [Oxalobacter formigenes]
MNSRELIKLLKQNGWKHVRTEGSHHMFEKKGNPNNIAVPHPKKDLDIGIVKGILKKAGL